ncbi:MAG: radical SAM protein [Sandaracinaceae bacterium]|nr:radical SAM protein [Sandaracinaceae bacterium]
MISGKGPQKIPIHRLIERAHARGVTVVVGGAGPTLQPDDYAGLADYVVCGESEPILDKLLADLERGVSEGTYRSPDSTDVSKAPLPRWDLVELDRYMFVGMSYTRGCPFSCEFCAQIEIFGRKPRVKSAAQIVAEHQLLFDLGYRGMIDLGYDNLIGDIGHTEEVLAAMLEWNRAHGHPFFYSTEATMNLARQPRLLELMRDNDFRYVFMGIESGDPAVLNKTKKGQNTAMPAAEAVRVVNSYGIVVNTGLILGFDGETGAAAEKMLQMVQQTGAFPTLVLPLHALPGTQLARRLASEQRLFRGGVVMNTDERTDTATTGLNFVTSRPRAEVLRDLAGVLEQLYQAENHYARVETITQQALGQAQVPPAAQEAAPARGRLREHRAQDDDGPRDGTLLLGRARACGGDEPGRPRDRGGPGRHEPELRASVPLVRRRAPRADRGGGGHGRRGLQPRDDRLSGAQGAKHAGPGASLGGVGRAVRPRSPPPQHSSAPPACRPQECSAPSASAIQSLASPTCVGTSRGSRSASPSCPSSLSPQQKSAPVARIAQVWAKPPSTALHGPASTTVGVRRGSRSPSPSWPWSPRPSRGARRPRRWRRRAASRGRSRRGAARIDVHGGAASIAVSGAHLSVGVVAPAVERALVVDRAGEAGHGAQRHPAIEAGHELRGRAVAVLLTDAELAERVAAPAPDGSVGAQAAGVQTAARDVHPVRPVAHAHEDVAVHRVPAPSCPCTFTPAQRRLPSGATTQVWRDPPAPRLASTPPTRVALPRSISSPRPSCPSLLAPKTRSAPSSASASV